MVKTQVYIPDEDHADLLKTAGMLGIQKSEALRQAAHEYCQKKSRMRYEQMIRKTAGLFRESPLDASSLRRETNEGFRV